MEIKEKGMGHFKQFLIWLFTSKYSLLFLFKEDIVLDKNSNLLSPIQALKQGFGMFGKTIKNSADSL